MSVIAPDDWLYTVSARDALHFLPSEYIFSAIQCNAMQCNAIQCYAMQYDAMQCNAMQCNAIQYSAIQCNAIRYNAVQCYVVFSTCYIISTKKSFIQFVTQSTHSFLSPINAALKQTIMVRSCGQWMWVRILLRKEVKCNFTIDMIYWERGPWVRRYQKVQCYVVLSWVVLCCVAFFFFSVLWYGDRRFLARKGIAFFRMLIHFTIHSNPSLFYLIPSHIISSHPILYYLIPSYIISSHLILSHVISSLSLYISSWNGLFCSWNSLLLILKSSIASSKSWSSQFPFILTYFFLFLFT